MELNHETQRPAYRLLANALTIARPLGTAAICKEIISKGPDFRSTQLAAKIGLVLLTDKADGISARYSGIKSDRWAKRDEQYDKITYDMFMASFAVATGDQRYLGYMVINEIRNDWVGHRRQQMRSYGITAAARPLGKLKTVVQAAAIEYDASPLGNTYPEFAHDLHQLSIGLTVASAVDIELHAHREMADLRRTINLEI